MEEEREKGWQKDGRREGRRKGNSPLENINQEQRARKENWNRYIKSNIPWSPGSRNRCLVRGASAAKSTRNEKEIGSGGVS